MPIQIQQTWFILQANAQQSSTVVQGPIFDSASASAYCQALATKSPGVAFIVVTTVAAFCTDTPSAVSLPIIVL